MQFTLITALALATLAAATPMKRNDQPASQCSTAPVQCCDTTGKASDPSFTSLLASIGVVLTDPTVLLAAGCSPLSVVGVGSGAVCNANAVCCQDNSHGSLISLGCVPVDINL